MRRLLAIALLVCAPALEGQALDPRIDQANSLLGDASGYARAIELYREVLEESPDDNEARLALARVLSWDRQFEDSLREYDRLLLDGVAGARSQRAAVLSWAGRYDEAESEFRGLLDDDPADAEAARGLARVLSWSGRRNSAARAYERALDLEDDPEARNEWLRLLEGYRPTLRSTTTWFRDSDDFQRTGTRAELRTYLDYETQVISAAGFLDVDTRQKLAGGREVSDDRGYEASFGVRRALSEDLSAELHVGVRGFERYGVSPLVESQLTWSQGDGSITLGIDHRDALDRTSSARAASKDIRDTGFSLSGWGPLGERFELWGRLQGAVLSDSNGRHGVASSLAWRPWRDHQFRMTLAAGYLGYTIDSPHYYAPRYDTTTRLGISHRIGLGSGFSLDLEAGGGIGYSEEDNEGPQFGPAYDVRGGVSWLIEPWRISLRAGRSQSQRDSTYATTTAAFDISVDF